MRRQNPATRGIKGICYRPYTGKFANIRSNTDPRIVGVIDWTTAPHKQQETSTPMAQPNRPSKAFQLPGAPRSLTGLLMATLLTACVEMPPEPPAAPPDPEAALPMPDAMNDFALTTPDQQVIGELQRVHARKDDTLSDIARRFNVGYEELVAANPSVDPWLPGEGADIIIPSQWVIPNGPRTGIVINLAAMRLFYFPPVKKGATPHVITHPVGIGRLEWNTPQGKARIASKSEAPTWRPTEAIRKEHAKDGEILPAAVPPGPDNPMGEYVMRLSWPEYAIHGTNKPASIGMRGTHGCLRMYPEDIAVLYKKVSVDTPVTVVNEPNLVGYRDDTLYLQTYPVLEDDKRNHHPKLWTLLKGAQTAHRKVAGKASTSRINDALVQAQAKQPRALAVPVTGNHAPLDQWLAGAGTTVKNHLPQDATWDGEGDASVSPAAVSPTTNVASAEPVATTDKDSGMTDAMELSDSDAAMTDNTSTSHSTSQKAAIAATTTMNGDMTSAPTAAGKVDNASEETPKTLADYRSGVSSD